MTDADLRAWAHIRAWVGRSANEPPPWDVGRELHGARGARGVLRQWTCDTGTVYTAPVHVPIGAPLPPGITPDDSAGVAHIGEACTCVYALRAEDGTTQALITFDDGVRLFAYVGVDACFD